MKNPLLNLKTNYFVSLIIGTSSNVWKAGGVLTAHSKLVASFSPSSICQTVPIFNSIGEVLTDHFAMSDD